MTRDQRERKEDKRQSAKDKWRKGLDKDTKWTRSIKRTKGKQKHIMQLVSLFGLGRKAFMCWPGLPVCFFFGGGGGVFLGLGWEVLEGGARFGYL
jgi:hypothetical protein